MGRKYGSREPGVVLHSSIYKYYKLTLFLILIRSLSKSQTFILDWPELGHIRVK